MKLKTEFTMEIHIKSVNILYCSQQLDTASLLVSQCRYPPRNTPGMNLAGFIEEKVKLKYTINTQVRI